MSDFIINVSWANSDDNDPILGNTTANLSVKANGIFLTQNINSWTNNIENSVRVSVYPLAKWFSYYWWRLESEYSVGEENNSDYDWRTAHELGAADNGYVWPFVRFVSDGLFMNISNKIIPSSNQSVAYIGGLTSDYSIPISVFQKVVSTFIESTIERVKDIDSDLVNLWNIVCEDINNPAMRNIRRLEAVLGFDPEECPKVILDRVLESQKVIGESSIAEFAPYLKNDAGLQGHLQNCNGIICDPQVKPEDLSIVSEHKILPWQYGVKTAHEIRKLYSLGDGPITNKQLLDLLGMASTSFNEYNKYSLSNLSVGRNNESGKMIIIPRKTRFQPNKRFELSRLLGDAILPDERDRNEWLIASDSKSFRQKYQRAFAAELLCPINSLDDFLKGNYSLSNKEKAASYYNVSDLAISTILYNNGRIEHPSFAE